MQPADVGATGREDDGDALQDCIRLAHIEGGMSGLVPFPTIGVNSLVELAAQKLATARVALPGEGAARVELPQ